MFGRSTDEVVYFISTALDTVTNFYGFLERMKRGISERTVNRLQSTYEPDDSLTVSALAARMVAVRIEPGMIFRFKYVFRVSPISPDDHVFKLW